MRGAAAAGGGRGGVGWEGARPSHRSSYIMEQIIKATLRERARAPSSTLRAECCSVII